MFMTKQGLELNNYKIWYAAKKKKKSKKQKNKQKQPNCWSESFESHT